MKFGFQGIFKSQWFMRIKSIFRQHVLK